MSKLEFTKENIYDLIDKVASCGISELSLKDADHSIKIKKELSISKSDATHELLDASNALKNQSDINLDKTISSPLVGTFYDCPAPDKPPFVTVGSKVKEGDVLFIVESMKLMNEIKSECSGQVSQILVKSGDSVEYGQPIIIME